VNQAAQNTALELRDVTVRFTTARNWRGHATKQVTALENVYLHINYGETLGVIGESGSGKSTLAKVILGLQQVDHGDVLLGDVPLDVDQSLQVRREWARNCQMVFQDPRSSLDPRLRVWQIISEGLEIQGGYSRSQLMQEASEVADQVGITASQLQRYPHELSGGQRQRIAIGRALVMKPQLLILDEPTSALDVTIQAQVLNVLLELQQEKNLTYLFISHDVSVIEHMCDRVAVLYQGRIVESGDVESVLTKPENDYTRELMAAVPEIDKESTSP